MTDEIPTMILDMGSIPESPETAEAEETFLLGGGEEGSPKEADGKPLTGSSFEDGREKAKSGPPTADEFQKFFAKVVIRSVTSWYLDFMFRGIDEDLISPRDLEKLELEDEELWKLARPFAEVSVKSKFMRKNGRKIIAMADSGEAVHVMIRWMIRVQLISARYRPKKEQRHRRQNVSQRPRTPQPAGTTANGNAGNNGHGHYPVGPEFSTEWPSTGSG